ncbi:hypothetical protein HYO65_gp180 [Tenacibaculum phage PTm1]|uniref:Uncharacterized protein n=2 Tax=Shirahamavirus PTm1 TaxID=2846435 RepID=A0A5S9EQL4_9CAUD|nr:hypothetical protein HYO65_gp180 [Tenacibaculum phage PTm1]BBI90572.1 hypothetical protein [Tenacibaculum phage PTm1]BBI90880.1 hypothetical protein [Tenacibaculum phage PTm5]
MQIGLQEYTELIIDVTLMGELFSNTQDPTDYDYCIQEWENQISRYDVQLDPHYHSKLERQLDILKHLKELAKEEKFINFIPTTD